MGDDNENRDLILASAPKTLTVTSALDDGSEGTLRQVLTLAEDGDTIEFALGGGNTIQLVGALEISCDLAINGGDDASVVIIAGANDRIFTLTGTEQSFTVRNLTLQSGSSDGGAVYFSGGKGYSLALTLSAVAMLSNNGTVGGAIYAVGENIDLALLNSILASNTAANDGGAVYVRAERVGADLTGTVIRGNASDSATSGDGNGGAVSIVADTAYTMTGATFSGNTTNGNGGAVWNYGDTTLENLEFSGNFAAGSGGAVFNEADASAGFTLTIRNSVLSGNLVAANGGAVCNDDGTLLLEAVTFAGNTAMGDGGGLYNETLGAATLSGATFSGNTANGAGGAMNNQGTATLDGTVFATAADTVVNGGTMALTGNNTFGADFTNFGEVGFAAAAITVISDGVRLINSAAAPVVTGGSFTLDRGSVRTDGGEFRDLIFVGDWDLSAGGATYAVTLDDSRSAAVIPGGSFTDAFDRTLWFGQSEGAAGITDHVKLNSEYAETDFQKFAARDAIAAAYADYDTWIEVTGGAYDYDLCGGAAALVVTGSATASGGVYGGADGDWGGNCSVTVNPGGALTAERICGGSHLTAAGSGTADSSVTVAAGGTAAATGIYAGFAAENGAVTVTGTATLTLNGSVAVAGYAVAGDIAASGARITRVGDTRTVISDGVYSWITVGGGMVEAANANYIQNGDAYLTITGGTFVAESVIFGACAGTRGSYGSHTLLNGNVTIVVDSGGTNRISLASLYAGSNGAGSITGSTSITFTGLGANLTFNDAMGGISGDSAHYSQFVQGDRALNFRAFSGNFDAPMIEKIDTITFTEGSEVVFTSDLWKAADIANWLFESGTSLDWQCAQKNSFAGDTLQFGDAGEALSAAWTVINSGSDDIFAGLAQAGGVTLFGESAAWDGDRWASDHYKMELNHENHSLVIAMGN